MLVQHVSACTDTFREMAEDTNARDHGLHAQLQSTVGDNFGTRCWISRPVTPRSDAHCDVVQHRGLGKQFQRFQTYCEKAKRLRLFSTCRPRHWLYSIYVTKDCL